MNKESFIQVLRNPKSISAEQLAQVEEVVEQFPYFQVARCVIASGSRSLSKEDAQAKLAKAAIYTTNRQLLKKYVSGELNFDVADNIQIGIHRDTQTKTIPSDKVEETVETKKIPKFRIIERRHERDGAPAGKGKFVDLTKKVEEEDIDEELTIIDADGKEKTTVTHTSIQTAKDQKEQAEKDAAEIDKSLSQEVISSNESTEEVDPSVEEDSVEEVVEETPVVIEPKPVQVETERPKPKDEPKLKAEELVDDVFKNLEAYRHSRDHYFEVEQSILNKQESDAIDNAIEKANSKIKKESKTTPKASAKVSATPSKEEKPKPSETTAEKTSSTKKSPSTGKKAAASKKTESDEPKPSKKETSIEMNPDKVDNNIVDNTSSDKDAVKDKSSDKKEVQKEIIEKFIKSNPKILPADEEPKGEIDDLSTASAEMHDDLATENLAIILSRQGKREKAIEIYEKLILKNPKKKSYFAARIAELK